MKSTLIWILCFLGGTACGYGLSFYLDINFYLLMVAGGIIGSTTGITINIHREDEFVFHEQEQAEQIEQKQDVVQKEESTQKKVAVSVS
jgi:hypothetical protein